MSDIIKNLTSEIQSKIDYYEPQMGAKRWHCPGGR